MKQNYWHKKPSSFAETVQLVENYVQEEIIRETQNKQLYYHTLDHALAVKRRANRIFQEIKFLLSESTSAGELNRLNCLINLCAMAHDMVQLFEPSTSSDRPRKRQTGVSEIATANKLIEYIQSLNQELTTDELDPSVLFSDRDRQIIYDAITATICERDPQASKASYSFSPYSIYQPYLYNSQSKISIVGSIIALADLGTLGIEGIENYVQDGILVFLEDNLDLKDLIINCNYAAIQNKDQVRARLLKMTRFMVSLAKERQARFEIEVAGFSPQARQILRDKIFIYFDVENIKKIETVVPTHENTSLPELTDFFCLSKHQNFA
ncbi:hypothetical protein IQ255_04465 [Pleurocapsales cyanobacterium LEGE 10410]|nr:hypothetical protein [Pleurocapsales cyanobacterium LEGE 10410]